MAWVFSEKIRIQMTEQFEQMLLIAILDNCEEQHRKAQEYATEHNFSQKQVDSACKRVLSFLRWHGIQKLHDNEKEALIKMQAFFRRLLVQKKLRKKWIGSLFFCLVAKILLIHGHKF